MAKTVCAGGAGFRKRRAKIINLFNVLILQVNKNKFKIYMKKNIKLIILLGLSLPILNHSILSLAGDAGTALKADALRSEPFADAKSVGTLAKNDAVDIVSKKGAWLQVKSKKSTGWVRLLSVKRGAATQTNQVGGIAAVASGRAGTGKVVSTTGIRGLSAEELKAAQFNESEMKKLESYEATASDGKQFASAGGLNTTSIAYLKGLK